MITKNQITTNATAISSTEIVISLYFILWIANASRSNASKCLLEGSSFRKSPLHRATVKLGTYKKFLLTINEHIVEVYVYYSTVDTVISVTDVIIITITYTAAHSATLQNRSESEVV